MMRTIKLNLFTQKINIMPGTYLEHAWNIPGTCLELETNLHYYMIFWWIITYFALITAFLQVPYPLFLPINYMI